MESPTGQRTVVEKIIERVVSGVTSEEFEIKLQQLNNKLMSEIMDVKNLAASKTSSNFRAIALTQKIDNLSGVTLNNTTFTGSVSGLNLDYLPLSGGTLTGDLAGTAANFSGDLTIDTGTLFVDSANNRVGIGTTTPTEKLEIDYGNLRLNQEPHPSTAPTITVNPTAGVLNGLYYYSVSFVTADGETSPKVWDYTNPNPVNEQVDLSDIPIGSSKVIARKLYRTLVNTPWLRFLTTINDNTTTTYTDNIAEDALGDPPPQLNTTGGSIYVNADKVMEADFFITLLGLGAGSVNGGSLNTFIGYKAGNANTSGWSNTVVGHGGFLLGTTGGHNTLVGFDVGDVITTGGYNTMLGSKAGGELTTGSNNILLGYRSGDNITTGSTNIVIGYNIDAPAVDSANILNIGNLIFGTGLDGTGTTLSSGNVGIGTTTPWRKLGVTGTVGFSSTLSTGAADADLNIDSATYEVYRVTSSKRYKENITDIDLDSSLIYDLRPVSFDWKEGSISSGKRDFGLIAEEVDEVLPELVSYNSSSTPESVKYSMLSVLNLKAIQELNLKIEELSNQSSVISSQTGILPSIDNILSWLSDKVVQAREFVADKIIVKKVITDALEIEDSVTGEVYCVRISNGEWSKIKGICGEAGILEPEPDPDMEMEPEPAVIPNQSSADTSDDTGQDSTPPTEEEIINEEPQVTTASEVIEETPPEETTAEEINEEEEAVEEGAIAEIIIEE